MLVIDSQVHVWDGGKPPHHHRQSPYSAEELLADMAVAGVDKAILVPPTWDPRGNAPSLEAAQRYPDRFAVMGLLSLSPEMTRDELQRWRAQPGMIGARLSFNRPDTRAMLISGAADWFWDAAEAEDLPIMLLVPGLLPFVAALAARHPKLRIIVDHLAVPRGAKGAQAFEHLPELLAMARFDNVAVKAAGLPGYAEGEPYPFRSLHPYVAQVLSAFGADRVFWGTDLSRMTCSYRECVTMLSEDLDHLSPQNRNLVMGDGLSRWLRWDVNGMDEVSA
ncbi:amidohydrolase family protein [Sphingobium boeckii]|uniref:L-fuconolactonase n=1 Tax=Sphingobium boeckii TaxID=1082345 RepID=A0A7W9EFX6_9SPHN|nr:amidohydrolase family protein [Sphingobium boeckii]MBB5687737.1 L-fuconolactonase [Sphingobium boeckii]